MCARLFPHRGIVSDLVFLLREFEVPRRQSPATFNVFNRLGSDLGLMGVLVSEEDGGSGMDAVAACIVHEELAYSDPALCLSYLAHSMLFVNNLAHNANAAQREKYLPGVLDGTKIGGMCMSEAGAGTDVLGMATVAKEQSDGSWEISGSKMWITNGTLGDGELGDVFLVYARTGDRRQDVSLFIVEKGMPGFALGQQIKDKCGMRASCTAELVFDKVKVPTENLVGDLHKGLIPMMRNLEIERVTLAAMSVGIARRCIDAMKQYASERTAFGKPIASFGQLQQMIGDSYAEYMAGKAYVYSTANGLDLASSGNRVDTDGVKLYMTKAATRIADRAIQSMGGYGYTGEYVVERMWRDAKLLEIGGGTLESHQKNITKDLKPDDKLP